MVPSKDKWHVSRVQKRVSKFSNFWVKNLQKMDLSDLLTMRSSYMPSWPSKNVCHLSGGIFKIDWCLWGSVLITERFLRMMEYFLLTCQSGLIKRGSWITLWSFFLWIVIRKLFQKLEKNHRDWCIFMKMPSWVLWLFQKCIKRLKKPFFIKWKTSE